MCSWITVYYCVYKFQGFWIPWQGWCLWMLFTSRDYGLSSFMRKVHTKECFGPQKLRMSRCLWCTRNLSFAYSSIKILRLLSWQWTTRLVYIYLYIPIYMMFLWYNLYELYDKFFNNFILRNTYLCSHILIFTHIYILMYVLISFQALQPSLTCNLSKLPHLCILNNNNNYVHV